MLLVETANTRQGKQGIDACTWNKHSELFGDQGVLIYILIRGLSHHSTHKMSNMIAPQVLIRASYSYIRKPMRLLLLWGLSPRRWRTFHHICSADFACTWWPWYFGLFASYNLTVARHSKGAEKLHGVLCFHSHRAGTPSPLTFHEAHEVGHKLRGREGNGVR